ncbi:hypothetical protein TL16_g06122 [Triparma laevis f. inornata]|uniref:Calcineurin-like phosphoesterase domain-containing protein n=2 Tax=Triparma laevis TaxID=1534972 RepID=A0A9W7FCR4_9STRA|nr:hypothetical protein TL16_g06122 [Triparma laevis f. inornata]GMI09736.1 hypothetical protein TrLO_g5313 [Triparma laevis f. longispina]
MVSDLHLGPLADSGDAQLSLDLLGVSEGNVDALMLVGDIGDQPINKALLEKFKPLKDAVEGGMEDRIFWTSGNHENIVGVQPYRDIIHEYGIINLENNFTHVTLPSCGSNIGVDFIGVADYTGYTRMTGGEGDTSQIIAPDIEYAASRIPEENIVNGNPLILLSHQPREWEKADTHGVNLMVSGHTHGGQAFPMHAFIINQEGNAGLFQPDESKDRYYYVVNADTSSPDTRLRAAQLTMYIAVVFFPTSLLFCCYIVIMNSRIKGFAKMKKTEEREAELIVQEKEEEV